MLHQSFNKNGKIEIHEMKNKLRNIGVLLIATVIMFQFCIKEKLPPVARFSISPAMGNTESIFIFDAGLSRNDQNMQDNLEARWDWENDGDWDTKFSNELLQEHQYEEAGTYTVKLEIKDKDRQRAYLSRNLTVTEAGPLYAPEVIFPPDRAVNQSLSIVLSWSCYHSENLDISYDIYFGEIPTPPKFKENYQSTILNPGYLESSKEYYWRIVAKDTNGNTTSSPLNRFFTRLVDERDGREYDVFQLQKTFWMAENLNYQTDTGYWCFGDIPYNCEIYGKLYNWEAAMVACPPGWHLPGDDEWKFLERSLGMTDVDNWGARGTVQADKIREGGSHPFNALLAGTRDLYGIYNLPEIDAGFWTSTGSVDAAYYRFIYFEQPYIYRNTLPAVFGLSVRCIKN